MLPLKLCSHLFSFYLSTTLLVFHLPFSCILCLLRTFVCVTISLIEKALELNFRLSNLSPCRVWIDEDTTMHFWASKHRQPNKPCLVLIHGFGGNSKWQFFSQVRGLSRNFNLYIPDLLFFGKSYTNKSDRSDLFQAACVGEGLKRLGVEKYSVVGISYGGYVAYRMAQTYEEEVKKVVIVSCGICNTNDQKEEQLKKIGMDAVDLLVPKKAEDLRTLITLSIYTYNPFSWVPDFLLKEFITVMINKHKREKSKLVKHLLSQKADPNLPILTQETLIVWGDKDRVFPLYLAHQLHRHLGQKSKLEIMKDTGHAVNIDSPDLLNAFIVSFILGQSYKC